MPNDPSNPTSTTNKETVGAHSSGDSSSADTGRNSGQPEFEQVNGKEANEAEPEGESSEPSADGSDTKLDAGTSPTGVGFGKAKM